MCIIGPYGRSVLLWSCAFVISGLNECSVGTYPSRQRGCAAELSQLANDAARSGKLQGVPFAVSRDARRSCIARRVVALQKTKLGVLERIGAARARLMRTVKGKEGCATGFAGYEQ